MTHISSSSLTWSSSPETSVSATSSPKRKVTQSLIDGIYRNKKITPDRDKESQDTRMSNVFDSVVNPTESPSRPLPVPDFSCFDTPTSSPRQNHSVTPTASPVGKMAPKAPGKEVFVSESALKSLPPVIQNHRAVKDQIVQNSLKELEITPGYKVKIDSIKTCGSGDYVDAYKCAVGSDFYVLKIFQESYSTKADGRCFYIRGDGYSYKEIQEFLAHQLLLYAKSQFATLDNRSFPFLDRVIPFYNFQPHVVPLLQEIESNKQIDPNQIAIEYVENHLSKGFLWAPFIEEPFPKDPDENILAQVHDLFENAYKLKLSHDLSRSNLRIFTDFGKREVVIVDLHEVDEPFEILVKKLLDTFSKDPAVRKKIFDESILAPKSTDKKAEAKSEWSDSDDD